MKNLGSDGWHEVTQLLPNLWAIKDCQSSEHAVCYLVCGSRKALLFDTGIGVVSLRRVVSSITPLPVVAVLSHWHFDHVGAAYEFDDVWAWESEQMSIASQKGIPTDVVRLYGSNKFLKSISRQQWRVKPFPNLKLLKEGQIIDLGGRVLHVLHTPGHTPDSISLYEPNERLLFAGDTAYAGELYLQFEEADKHQYLRSIDGLAKLPVSSILPGHGNAPVSGDLLKEIQRLLFDLHYKSKKYPELSAVFSAHFK